jgi:hypothetical protein
MFSEHWSPMLPTSDVPDLPSVSARVWFGRFQAIFNPTWFSKCWLVLKWRTHPRPLGWICWASLFGSVGSNPNFEHVTRDKCLECRPCPDRARGNACGRIKKQHRERLPILHQQPKGIVAQENLLANWCYKYSSMR